VPPFGNAYGAEELHHIANYIESRILVAALKPRGASRAPPPFPR
jgi:hypothetical protein